MVMRVPGARPRIPPGIWTETYRSRKEHSEPAKEALAAGDAVAAGVGVSVALIEAWQKIVTEATTRIRVFTRVKGKLIAFFCTDVYAKTPPISKKGNFFEKKKPRGRFFSTARLLSFGDSF